MKENNKKECPHGNPIGCKDHEPIWISTGRRKKFRPEKNIFGRIKTTLFKHCCGVPLQKFLMTEEYQCKECKRTEERIVKDEKMLICPCCKKVEISDWKVLIGMIGST